MTLKTNQCLKIWLIIISLMPVFSSVAADMITLRSDQEISQQTLGDDNAEFTLLWLHSEQGVVENLKSPIGDQ